MDTGAKIQNPLRVKMITFANEIGQWAKCPQLKFRD
jgi:hypothetical protein